MKKTIPSLALCLSLAALLNTQTIFAEAPAEVKPDVATAESVKEETPNKESHGEWGYSGAEGPEHWGDLSSKFTTCKTGKNQSPIDIKDSMDANLEPIKMDYSMLTASDIINNGHTIQVNMWSGSGGSIVVDGITFKLKQFHFHTPSENTINGQNFPLEAHFVHLSEDNEIAVLAMLFVPGKEDPTLKTLWENIPANAGETDRVESDSLKSIEMDDKLVNYYRYNGSLTTPPCSEGVRWIVMKQPSTVSKEQIEKLQSALKHPNNRPVQPINARIIFD